MADAYFFLFFLFFLLPLLLLVVLYFLVKPRPVKIPLKNRHVFITGGSSGIGLALAHRAAAEGARVSILARSLGKLEEARNAIRLATGIEVAVFAADVRDFEAVKRAVDEAGPIDLLLLNHGVFVALELEKMELSEIKFTMDVNLMGTLNLIKAALPAMKNRKDPLPASIALVSSQAGQKTGENLTHQKHCSSHCCMTAAKVASKSFGWLKSGKLYVFLQYGGNCASPKHCRFSPQRSFFDGPF
ncbi:3-dehydrosphinganine reductase TSC10A isoform X1 [Vigna umbellata]|uniref:3-dehydrosphinganine reductase TSC10A isoform X1 n=1 Tax=Vigna umbellata TaxID=87088 RepID=UPI001F5F491B|nr:3-dehydrosphinganine reductase TSC10A isoform X1 [Vigna umbellata]